MGLFLSGNVELLKQNFWKVENCNRCTVASKHTAAVRMAKKLPHFVMWVFLLCCCFFGVEATKENDHEEHDAKKKNAIVGCLSKMTPYPYWSLLCATLQIIMLFAILLFTLAFEFLHEVMSLPASAFTYFRQPVLLPFWFQLLIHFLKRRRMTQMIEMVRPYATWNFFCWNDNTESICAISLFMPLRSTHYLGNWLYDSLTPTIFTFPIHLFFHTLSYVAVSVVAQALGFVTLFLFTMTR